MKSPRFYKVLPCRRLLDCRLFGCLAGDFKWGVSGGSGHGKPLHLRSGLMNQYNNG
ncbi:hypothetical protein MOB49_10905 [Bacillus haynesii]|nr:hypothetical protein [Bacillus haynesii]UIN45426.1 hypothetical protein LXN06_17245 [Bacillus licheniformis]MBU8683307.1 hypothetical protein [Bacillus haynesii]MCY7800572.1 hypothetical protein [Bacillus haynesii]MCY7837769.1 hypothetical protein [Bacillus haynesii]MCY7846489.1 hypothetical protein [Bacillus haynesii]